jgi:proteasome lid subunit RPN8/RPN11
MHDEIAIHRGVLDAIVAHARDEAPNECCGLLVGRDDAHPDTNAAPPAVPDHSSPVRVADHVRCTNLEASPVRYRLDPAEHFAAIRRLRGTSDRIVGAYHSHPRSPAVPSATDLDEAFYPEFVWLIVSLAGTVPDVRAYRIAEGNFVPLRIVLLP